MERNAQVFNNVINNIGNDNLIRHLDEQENEQEKRTRRSLD